MREQIPYPCKVPQRKRDSKVRDRTRGLEIVLHQISTMNPYEVDDKAATAKRAKAGKEHVWLFQSFEDEILAAQLHQWLRLLSLMEGKSRTLHRSGSINVVQLSSKISPALYLQNLPEIGGHLPKHV